MSAALKVTLTSKSAQVWRRALVVLGVVVALTTAFSATGAQAQRLRPHEPLNPAKAQSLPISPLAIKSAATEHQFTVELAQTETQRSTGLMHRNYLAPDRGMLFNFHTERPEQFWMRNTFIPLDILFVRATGEIIFIAQETTPHSDKPVGPTQPVQAVLELAGGTTKRLGIKIGDTVQHDIFRKSPPQ